jgi:polyisoprenoid-binding protein YceI
MKKLFFAVLFILPAIYLSAQTYAATDTGSKVKFVIKNFGIKTGGTFEGLEGTILFDPSNLATANFDVSVKTKTVDTDIEARDNHLRKPEYFDVENFPNLIFKSTKVSKTNKPEYLYMFGNITIKGVTKEVNFPFTYAPKGEGYLFEGEFKLNRIDFGVGGKSFSLSDELTVSLSVFAKKI